MASNKLNICYVIFDFNSDFKISPTKFRGFMAHLFSNISEFHHHSEQSYHYPLIQYKRINSKLAIIGIGKYADIVNQNIPSIEHITTETQKIPVNNIQLTNSVFDLQYSLSKYRFISPWIALNKQNYEKYRTLSGSERKKILEKVLVGNILSMYKGLGIFIQDKIEVSILKQISKPVTAHENRFIGFHPIFASNTKLPEFFGVGKSVSKGFGTIQEIK